MSTFDCYFSPDYGTARQRFRQATESLGWELESHPIGPQGPEGEDLAIDIAMSPHAERERCLVLSSGLHGVEGFFGSAVQLGMLERWKGEAPPVRCVLMHALNPYGFAWLRRFDQNNIDPNRNFLLDDESYSGAPEGYAKLNDFLNPQRPPSKWEPFTLKAMLLIARHGMRSLKQAIATGQYEFPKGLFFGGSGPSITHRLLDEHMDEWLRGSREVMHLDLHTGLGKWGISKLLLDTPMRQEQLTKLEEWFGKEALVRCKAGADFYESRGGFGPWCVAKGFAESYMYACAEFGTYNPIRVVSALRSENQAHHWAEPGDASREWAKAKLKERFCPASEVWRARALADGLNLVNRAVSGLVG